MEITKAELEKIFPAQKTNDFFEALYGGAEDGAYDIVLAPGTVGDKAATFFFDLQRREGQCLKCSLTYGLPQVFQRHPIINIRQIVKECADLLGWGESVDWRLDPVEEINDDLHRIPLVITRK